MVILSLSKELLRGEGVKYILWEELNSLIYLVNSRVGLTRGLHIVYVKSRHTFYYF